MSLPFVLIGPSSGLGGAFVSGPAQATKRMLEIPFGDDYTADIPITLDAGIDYTTCTAKLGLKLCGNSTIGLEKSISIVNVSGNLYARLALVQANFADLIPGIYEFDIEVRTAGNLHGTKVMGRLKILKTIVAPVAP